MAKPKKQIAALPVRWTKKGKGIEGEMSKVAIGTYDYKKKLVSGDRKRCRVKLYPMHVQKTRKKWRERNERKRKWFTIKGAARAVNEPELVDILKEMARAPRDIPQLEEFRKAS